MWFAAWFTNNELNGKYFDKLLTIDWYFICVEISQWIKKTFFNDENSSELFSNWIKLIKCKRRKKQFHSTTKKIETIKLRASSFKATHTKQKKTNNDKSNKVSETFEAISKTKKRPSSPCVKHFYLSHHTQSMCFIFWSLDAILAIQSVFMIKINSLQYER